MNSWVHPLASHTLNEQRLHWQAQHRASSLNRILKNSMNKMKSNFNSLMKMKELDPSYLGRAMQEFQRAAGYRNGSTNANSSTPYDINDLIAKSNTVEEAFYAPQAELLGAFQNQFGSNQAYPGASGGLRPVGAVGYEAGAAINSARTENKHNVFNELLRAQQQYNLQALQNQQQNQPQLDPSALLSAASGWRSKLADIYGNWGDRVLSGVSGAFNNAPYETNFLEGGGGTTFSSMPQHVGSYYEGYKNQSPDSYTNTMQQQDLQNQYQQQYNQQMGQNNKQSSSSNSSPKNNMTSSTYK